GRGRGRRLGRHALARPRPLAAVRQDGRLRAPPRALPRARHDAAQGMSAEQLHPAPAPLAARTKRLLIGRPRETRELEETLLSKTLALPIFSSDPILSGAYA